MSRSPIPAPTPALASAATSAPDPVERLLGSMTLEQRVGQVFMLGFEGTAVDTRCTALVRGLRLGGVTLFARNVVDAYQTARLTRDLQALADPCPLFVAADQEGGLVVRVTTGATVFPGNMALGAAGDAGLTEAVAVATADELRAMGINMNLAPVMDVNTNPRNPVIGVRSFGSSPAIVEKLGVATILAFQQGGISAVAKHFPGHGDTAVDSHRDLPVVSHGLARLREIEFAPFEAAIRAGVDGIMTAHLYVPAVEPQSDLPATLSRRILTGLLRETLGFQGLILTDALDMGAIKKTRTAAAAAVDAFEAGADLLLVAGITAEDRARLAEGPAALLAAVKQGRVTAARLEVSVRRVLAAKAARGLLEPAPASTRERAVISSEAHQQLAARAARESITLLRNTGNLLPLTPEQAILVITPAATTRSPVIDTDAGSTLGQAVRRLAPGARVMDLQVDTAASLASVAAAARAAQVVILASYDLVLDRAQQELASALQATGARVVGVALRGPFDAEAAPWVPAYLAAYGDRPVHLIAAADALFGKFQPAGRVP